MASIAPNVHAKSVEALGREWAAFDQTNTAEFPHFFGLSEYWQDFPDAFSARGWVRHCDWLAQQKAPVRPVRSILRKIFRGGDVPNYLAIPWRFMRNRAVSVLDVGGGFGDNYALMPVAGAERVSWHVVDNPCSIGLGRETHAERPGLSFSANLAGEHDLALLIGTLQYVRDWRGLLAEIARLGRPRIYIARCPIRRDGPSFLTRQAVCPPVGPTGGQKVGDANVTVIGHDDLRRAMAAIGYRLEEEAFDRDMSRDFARLPVSHRNVAYVHSLWLPNHVSIRP